MAGRDGVNEEEVPAAIVHGPLLIEAALLSYDAGFDRADYDGRPDRPVLPTGNAVDRGWQPLDAVVPGGVQVVELSSLGAPVPFSSAAHFYVGEVEGERTLAAAFRGTDEGNLEIAFEVARLGTRPGGEPIYGADLYQAAHADAAAEALTYARDPANGIERILITGHSLGGIIAELTTARVLQSPSFSDLEDEVATITFGSPGSPPDATGERILNIIHSDDLIARLSDLSPLFGEAGVERDGRTLTMDRPEGTLPDFEPEDLDTRLEVLAALLDEDNTVEHSILYHIDTARLLAESPYLVAGAEGQAGNPLRWLDIAADRGEVGTAAADLQVGDWRSEVLFGRDGEDVLRGRHGGDGLSAGNGDDLLYGGLGEDRLAGNGGDDRIHAGPGDDMIHLGRGTDWVDGGPGWDTAVLDRGFAQVDVGADGVAVTVAAGEVIQASLTHVERLVLDDGLFTLDRDGPTFHPAAADPMF
jgi:hypothetical protein